MHRYCVTVCIPEPIDLSPGNAVVIGFAVSENTPPVNASVAEKAVVPRSVTSLPTWFTAGVLLTVNDALIGASTIPVPAAMDGIVQVIRPVPGLYVGTDDETVLDAIPTNAVPDCRYADTVIFDASVA